MNVQIQSVKFDADRRLIDFVEAKMAKLDRFAERSTGADVILKLDKDHEKGNKIATITLSMPGEELVASHQAKTFAEAVDDAIDALTRQLESGVNTFHIFCGDTLSHDLENVVGTLLTFSVVIVLHD